jgi:hypothetical protein
MSDVTDKRIVARKPMEQNEQLKKKSSGILSAGAYIYFKSSVKKSCSDS